MEGSDVLVTKSLPKLDSPKQVTFAAADKLEIEADVPSHGSGKVKVVELLIGFFGIFVITCLVDFDWWINMFMVWSMVKKNV